MTVLFALDGCRCVPGRSGTGTGNEDAAFAATGSSPPPVPRAATPQLKMRVRANDGNAQIPPSAAWHRCLTVQLRA